MSLSLVTIGREAVTAPEFCYKAETRTRMLQARNQQGKQIADWDIRGPNGEAGQVQ